MHTRRCYAGKVGAFIFQSNASSMVYFWLVLHFIRQVVSTCCGTCFDVCAVDGDRGLRVDARRFLWGEWQTHMVRFLYNLGFRFLGFTVCHHAHSANRFWTELNDRKSSKYIQFVQSQAFVRLLVRIIDNTTNALLGVACTRILIC